MRRREDDLVAWADDPVVRALLAPAADDELAGDDEIMTAFRRAHGAHRRRPGARHLGAGVTTVVVALALSGGVAAAAYTHALPAPVQSAMHAVFGDVGVPPADTSSAPHRAARRRHHGSATSGPTAAAAGGGLAPAVAPDPHPSAAPAPPAASPAPSTAPTPPTAGEAQAAQSPTAQPSPTPSTSASAAPSPAALAVSPVRSRVPAGQRAALRGTLTMSDGSPVAGYRLYLLQRPAGSSTWSRVAQGRTASDGTITLRSPQLTRNVTLRLGTGRGLHSRDVTIVELPRVGLSYAVTKDSKHYVVTVTVAGAQTSDTVALARLDNGSWTVLRRKQLDDTMQLTFTLPAPTSGSVRYRIRVLKTDLHGQRDALFALSPPA